MIEYIKTHKRTFILILGGLVILTSILFTPKETDILPPVVVDEPQLEPTVQSQYLYVDIKGEVKHPGVYKILYPARLFQAIELAGGFTNDADKLAINLARYISDQEAVYIPNITDKYPPISDKIDQENDTRVININTATTNELEELKGVGPSTAQAIITYREEHGPFQTIEGLLDVPGIGEATLKELAPFIVV